MQKLKAFDCDRNISVRAFATPLGDMRTSGQRAYPMSRPPEDIWSLARHRTCSYVVNLLSWTINRRLLQCIEIAVLFFFRVEASWVLIATHVNRVSVKPLQEHCEAVMEPFSRGRFPTALF